MGHESETKNRLLLSKLDWFLILLTAFAVVSGGVFLYQKKQAVVPTVEIQYALLISDLAVREDGKQLWEYFEEHSAVYNQNGTAKLGNVLSVDVREHYAPILSEGRVVLAPRSGRVDVIVSVKALAHIREGDGLRVEDIRIAAGGMGDFRIGECQVQGVQILSVKEMRNG